MYKLLTDDHLEYADRSYVDESFCHSIKYIQIMFVNLHTNEMTTVITISCTQVMCNGCGNYGTPLKSRDTKRFIRLEINNEPKKKHMQTFIS